MMKAPTLTLAIAGTLLLASAGLVALPHLPRSASAGPVPLPAKAPSTGRAGSSNSNANASGGDFARKVLDPARQPVRVHEDLPDACERLRLICATGNMLERRRHLAELIEDYSTEDYLDGAEALLTLGLGAKSPECQMVLSAWVEKEPEVAMEQLGQGCPLDALAPLIRLWAERDPQAAMDWLERHNPQEKAELAGQVLGVAMKKDPIAARAMLEQLPPQIQSQAMRNSIPRDIGIAEPARARAWVEGMPETFREAAAGMLIEVLPGSRTAEKLEWMREYPQLAAPAKFCSIYEAWLRSDEEAAISAVAQVPEGPLRDAAYSGLYRAYLTRGDEKAALEFFERSMPDFDEAKLDFFLSQTRNKAPLLSLDLVPRLTDESQRNARYKWLLENWSQQDPVAAKAWMEKHELPQAVREALEER